MRGRSAVLREEGGGGSALGFEGAGFELGLGGGEEGAVEGREGGGFGGGQLRAAAEGGDGLEGFDGFECAGVCGEGAELAEGEAVDRAEGFGVVLGMEEVVECVEFGWGQMFPAGDLVRLGLDAVS